MLVKFSFFYSVKKNNSDCLMNIYRPMFAFKISDCKVLFLKMLSNAVN